MSFKRREKKIPVAYLYPLFKSAHKMQENRFQSPKIQKCFGRACPQTPIKCSTFTLGWPRSSQMSGSWKFQLCCSPGKWQRYATVIYGFLKFLTTKRSVFNSCGSDIVFRLLIINCITLLHGLYFCSGTYACSFV